MGAALLFRFPPIPSCLLAIYRSFSSRSVAVSFDFVSISFSVPRIETTPTRSPEKKQRSGTV